MKKLFRRIGETVCREIPTPTRRHTVTPILFAAALLICARAPASPITACSTGLTNGILTIKWCNVPENSGVQVQWSDSLGDFQTGKAKSVPLMLLGPWRTDFIITKQLDPHSVTLRIQANAAHQFFRLEYIPPPSGL